MTTHDIEAWIAERDTMPELAMVLILVARRMAEQGVGLTAVAGAVFRAFDLSLEHLDVSVPRGFYPGSGPCPGLVAKE